MISPLNNSELLVRLLAYLTVSPDSFLIGVRKYLLKTCPKTASNKPHITFKLDTDLVQIEDMIALETYPSYVV
jgi:hypothetical protein